MQLLPQSNIRTKQTNTKHSRIKQSVWTDSGPDISSMTNIKTWISLLTITRQKIINPLFHSVMWETAGLTTTTTVSGKTTTETTQMKPTTLTSLQDGLFLQDQGINIKYHLKKSEREESYLWNHEALLSPACPSCYRASVHAYKDYPRWKV